MQDRERDLADLTALADGTLPAGRRAEVERRVAASPELAATLERQRSAVAAVRAAAVPAPAALRARLPSRRERRKLRMPSLGLAAAAAVAAVLALFLLPARGPEAPSVADAAALAARDPAGAPPPRYDHAQFLDREVGGIHFPRWEERFGWRATGARSDTLGERPATTVYYGYEGRRLGYTIVGGKALAEPGSWRASVHAGTRLRAARLGGRTVVTWRRRGHTCVLSARGVPARTLVALASWRAGGGIEY